MHFAFVDFVYFYDAGRPEQDAPLGGTTSAICFLAREMVKAGVSCTFFNRVSAPFQAHGIKSLPFQALAEDAAQYDVYIFCGRWSAELVQLVRAHTNAPLIAWMHESQFKEPLTPSLDTFDGVVFVSEWQRRINQPLARPNWQQVVIRNAMNPAVAMSFPVGASVFAAKTIPPVLLFAGSFARGAFHIPPLLDRLRAKRTEFTVEMYCNLDPSRDADKDAAYIGWIRSLPNMAHVGMVGQQELARRMKKASVMLAPNPWPETSCIALIEGLASGLAVVTTNRAALPETAAGFARLIMVDGADEPERFDMPVDYDAFADSVLAAFHDRERSPVETEDRLRQQVDHFHTHYQWSQRVAPWVEFVKGLLVK
jgi:glycosyltransferase involved in cell wall biosynthesis